ncbi:MAG: hypothetical protein JKY95_03850 [Planctomycetaceae bacterium]|nr:hypothetical protein [Planctomycetaceae bacterium]
MQNKSISRSTRSAYTLIELIIASVLVSALMSTIWGVMSMYNSLLSAGKAEVTEQQLVRSLFQLMFEDLGTALTPLEERKIAEVAITEEDSDLVDQLVDMIDEESPPSRSVFESSSKVTNPAAPIFLGTSTAIRMTTHRVVQQAQKSDIDLLNELGGGSAGSETVQEGQSPSVSEFQTVIYQFQFPGEDGASDSLPAGLYRIQVDSLDLFTLMNDRSTLQESRSTDDVQVDRLTLESLLFPQEDQLGDLEESEFETEVIVPQYDLVPEVVGCEFEYFDGKNWGSQWPAGENSDVSYPAAIRIRLDVINTEELEKLTALDTPAQDSQEIEQELNDSFSAESDQIQSNPGQSDTEAELSPLSGITPRSYWRIILLENPEPQYESLGLGSFGESSSDFGEGF